MSFIKKTVGVGLLVATITSVQAHGLSPQRLEAPSGAELISYKFTASNGFKEPQLYEVECFKENFKQPAECQAMPGEFWVAPRRKRFVTIQIKTSGNGVYLACTKQVPREDAGASVVTRVCARWGVGVSPAVAKSDSAKQHKSTSGSSVGTRNR